MKTHWCWIVAGVLAAQAAVGQDLARLRAELAGVDAQLRAAREQAAKSPQLEGQRAAMVQAAQAYDAAAAAIPEVKAVDEELARVRSRLAELVKARQAALEANRKELAAARQAREAAEAAFRTALLGGEPGEALLQRREALRLQLAQGERAARAPVPVPAGP